ncbi:hypothetical protein VP01_3540g2 [Puccinia sorghi]|uniref:Flavin reductase like domain-containing protein n=1 Tax=Puccinia sorghi TaxID=27349 RepID=A0A0L6UWB6_9BASI|nr:hypothetical protein VP01_3540g2 [Puccinia sorghi]
MSHHPPFKQVEQTRPDFNSGHVLRFTKTVQPDWQVGQGLNNAPLPHAKIYHSPGPTKTFIPYQDISPPEMYKLMISSVVSEALLVIAWLSSSASSMPTDTRYSWRCCQVPRPIGFCSTLSADGRPNLAPFSYFNAAGSNPPCVMMSCTTNSTSVDKDTAANIRNTKQFVIAIISESFIEAANYTSINTPPDVSEWTLSGLTPGPSVKVRPARVQEAAVNMECELDPTKLTQVIVIGNIKAWHVKSDVLVDGSSAPMVDLEKLMPISRLGGISYARVLERFELPRPVWEEEKEKDQVKKVLSNQKDK